MASADQDAPIIQTGSGRATTESAGDVDEKRPGASPTT